MIKASHFYSIAAVFFVGALRLTSAFSVANPTSAALTPDAGLQDVKPIPITVLAGFLGSGKTTLLQNLLENNEGLRIAVVVNDVASVNIDSKLVANQNLASGMVELQNGCACCSRSEELLASVQELVTLSDTRGEGESFHHIVVEMSGVGDPRSVRAKFQEAVLYDMPLMQRAQLDTMVTVVDCSSFLTNLNSDKVATPEDTPELYYRDEDEAKADRKWMEDDDLPPGLLEAIEAGDRASANAVADLLVSQTEIADIVLLNKVDLVDESSRDMKQIENIVAALNPRATLLKSAFGKVSLQQILGVAQGMGVAEAGIIDDHKDAVNAALEMAHDPDCEDPNCVDPSHSEVVAVVDCAKPDCTDSSHEHSHTHACDDPACDDPAHAKMTVCGEPGCTDSHEHSHTHACDDPSCDDPAHANTVAESVCNDPGCTESHEHSHAHACDDPSYDDPSHGVDVGTHAGIGTYVYTSRRPFHPTRLLSFLRNLPATRGLPPLEAGEPDLAVSATAKSAMKKILRSKGFVWCADSFEVARYWSHAGISFELTNLGKWWATLPREQWPQEAIRAILADYDDANHDDQSASTGTVGDRRQEVVLIGPGMGGPTAQKEVSSILDKCLLRDDELDFFNEKKLDEGALQKAFPNPIQAGIMIF
jgi:G3E family GTPase